MTNANFSRIYLAGFLLLSSFLKLFYTAKTPLGLFTEEAQYWLWSKNLDWNFYSKPPLIAVYNFISTSVLGDTETGVRINAAFFSVAAAWMVFEFTLHLFRNPTTALWAAVLLLMMPSFHIASFFHTPDSSLIFYWIAALYFGWRAIEEGRLGWWVLAGIFTAFGILSKSIMVLIIPVFLIHLIIYRPDRLVKKEFYIFAAISSISLIPFIIWNLQNDLVTLRHFGTLMGIVGEKNSIQTAHFLKNPIQYVISQFLIISPFYLTLLWLSIKKINVKGMEKTTFLIIPALFTWLYFLGISFFKRVEVNWPAFAYVSLPILMAWAIHSGSSVWKKYSVIVVCITGILFVMIMLPQPLDTIGYKKILKPKNDPLARLAGFRETGQAVNRIIGDLPHDKYFIFSESYHFSSEMAFYVDGNPMTYCINLGRRMNQFDLWPGIDQFENKGYIGIFVARTDEYSEEVMAGFERLVATEKVYGLYRGDTVRTLNIFVLENFKGIKEVKTDQY